ncbi:MAG TPA: 3-deoxy-D-manno-octulosonic acid transferase [Candidatus Acidoferrum sp.]|nr:3-deoxy-D-manno-octulosonic acid transferase [Candidatus Acidoferrum sp.]
MYFLYSFLMGLAALLTSPYWLIQGLRHGKYLSNLGQRLGFSILGLDKLPAQHPGSIWIHAVSVGEALSGVTLARRLKDAYPQRPLVVSTTTLTGYALAKERMTFADAVIFFPLDWAFSVHRVLDAVKPAIVIILETEIWPNFLRESARRNIPVLFVSGRISDRSFSRWQSYLGAFGFYLKPLLKSALNQASAFLMQSQQDADRIRALGAPPEKITVSGNLKYDLELPAPTPLAKWLEQEVSRLGRRPLIVAGSVVATEEPLALLVFGVVQGDFPKALLVLAPRKPERFAPAAEFIEESHRKYVRRSELSLPGPGISTNNGANSIPDDVTVLLLDSIGELASLYRLADGVFVGGSLVDSGGHNILEPAAFGKVPVFGPSMENFAAMAARFVESKAAIQVESPEDAGVEMIHLLKDPEKMQRMGGTARQLVESSRGALDRALAAIAQHLDQRQGGSAR